MLCILLLPNVHVAVAGCLELTPEKQGSLGRSGGSSRTRLFNRDLLDLGWIKRPVYTIHQLAVRHNNRLPKLFGAFGAFWCIYWLNFIQSIHMYVRKYVQFYLTFWLKILDVMES
jgi:hypothetical protein